MSALSRRGFFCHSAAWLGALLIPCHAGSATPVCDNVLMNQKSLSCRNDDIAHVDCPYCKTLQVKIIAHKLWIVR